MKTFLSLFTIGVLLCSTSFALTPANEPITLTDNNHIVFSGEVNDKSVSEAQIKLGQLAATLSPNATIYLVLDTPGGSVSAGNSFIDFANALPQKIKPISLFAASMGYHMFQSFDERIVIPSSTLMSHRVRLGGLSGQVPGELNTRLLAITAIAHQMDESVARRIGMSVADYKALIHDELWLNGQNAVNQNHADRIAKVRCSTDLINGTRTQEFDTLFGPVTATFSSCPLISGILGFKLGGKRVSSGVVYQTPRNNAEVVREIQKAKRRVILGVY